MPPSDAESTKITWDSPAPRAVFVLILLVLAILSFAQLGEYTLWDDESLTALAAQGILRTGDTSIRMDHGNIVGYTAGLHVRDFCDRAMSPLPAYLTAASFALFGQSAWSARAPFALLGFGACALILVWVRRESWPVFAAVSFGLIGNVSLILYCRQCRYYAMSVLFSNAIVFIYWRWKPVPRTLLSLAALSVLLFAANYLHYLALYACLTLDYLIWRRKEWPLAWRDGLILFGPQVVVNGIIGYVWNPLGTAYTGSTGPHDLGDRLEIWVMNWRDANTAEFFALPILLLALVVGIAQRRTWMVRGCVAMAVFITFVTFAGSQPPALWTWVANVRYLVPIIPLAIALEAGVICALLGRVPWLAILVAALVFGTNLFNGGPLLADGFRSTLAAYIGELLHPPPEPYTPVADWINANVPDGESVWVMPDYSTYPLMFRAPRALYAWQLDWPPRPDFASLPRIHFKGQEPPDYLVAFGPFLYQMVQRLQAMGRTDVQYAPVAMVPVFWKDMYRPELFWRTFTPITGFDPQTQAVYIFRRVNPPINVTPKP